jgi:hypothetical protein
MTMISTMHDMDMVCELADVGYIMQSGGRIDLYGTMTDLFFHHDLAEYNLAPPPLAQLITRLNAHGLHLPLTLDVEKVAEALLHR